MKETHFSPAHPSDTFNSIENRHSTPCMFLKDWKYNITLGMQIIFLQLQFV